MFHWQELKKKPINSKENFMKKLFLAMLVSFIGTGILNAEEATTKENVKEPPKVVNLLRNGGFEDGKNGIWKANFTLELEHNDVVEGKTALKVPEDVKSFRICQYYKKGEGDDTFKLKCKVKGPAGRRIYSALVLDYKKNGVNKCQKKTAKN